MAHLKDRLGIVGGPPGVFYSNNHVGILEVDIVEQRNRILTSLTTCQSFVNG